MNSIRSRVFFVGNLPYKSDIRNITKVFGQPVIEDKDNYDFLCSYFHKSHIDAMIEAESQSRPRFLKSVRHYSLVIDRAFDFSFYNRDSGRLNVLDGYKMIVKGLHVYCFPLRITLFAIDIDDSGSSLDDLTFAHSIIRELPSRWEGFPTEFKEALNPIKSLVPDGNIKGLIARGNKLKIFQFALVSPEDWTEGHLYEIATCSPINVVGTTHELAPSDEYYSSIIKENTIEPFKDWKSLSLTDSYTTLFKTEGAFDKDMKMKWSGNEIRWINSYYTLIYLRVLVQKTFLSSRNEQYRLNKSNTHLMRDLTRMEQYYFYDNISYNFLPDMLNKQMEKSMAINEEREELSTQIKEKGNKNINALTGIVSAFAVFSIAYDFYGMVLAITNNSSPLLPFIIGIVASISIIYLIAHFTDRL